VGKGAARGSLGNLQVSSVSGGGVQKRDQKGKKGGQKGGPEGTSTNPSGKNQNETGGNSKKKRDPPVCGWPKPGKNERLKRRMGNHTLGTDKEHPEKKKKKKGGEKPKKKKGHKKGT